MPGDIVARIVAHQPRKQEREYELERIDAEQNKKQEHCVQEDAVGVFQPVAARIDVVHPPDPNQQRKAHGKRKQALQVCHERGIAVGHFQRDHQQCQRKSEDHIAEGFKARNLPGPPAEVLFGKKPWTVLGSHLVRGKLDQCRIVCGRRLFVRNRGRTPGSVAHTIFLTYKPVVSANLSVL